MSRTSKIKSLNKINEKELKLGITGNLTKSWHQVYSDSAWIYIGGLDYDLNEGDIIAVFSQYGEIVNLNLVRDSKTGKSKGFGFLCYQDQRSTILAVDNFNGTKICNRPIQVDHCNYKTPKFKESVPEEIRKVWEEGCAPKPINIKEDDLKAKIKAKKKERKEKLKEIEDTVLPIDEKESKEIRKVRKRIKKEQKALKKLEKRERKRMRETTPDEERGHADDEGRWDTKKKRLDEGIEDDIFYGSSDHFNFTKKRKEPPPAPTYNVRPDFDKADWRDIEMFKVVREHERRLKGETGKPAGWKEEEHYVPQRLGGQK